MKRRNLKLLKREQDGNVAMEFGLIAPILFLLFFGIIEFGLIQFATAVIESASQSATRLGSTGNFDVRNEISRRTGGIISPDDIQVTSEVVLPGDADGARALVRHRIAYRWNTITPFLDNFFGGDGVNIVSFCYVKNEPY